MFWCEPGWLPAETAETVAEITVLDEVGEIVGVIALQAWTTMGEATVESATAD